MKAKLVYKPEWAEYVKYEDKKLRIHQDLNLSVSWQIYVPCKFRDATFIFSHRKFDIVITNEVDISSNAVVAAILKYHHKPKLYHGIIIFKDNVESLRKNVEICLIEHKMERYHILISVSIIKLCVLRGSLYTLDRLG